jgi:hypothetical protein
LPLGIDLARGVVAAAALMKERQPIMYARLRIHFVGTSNQTSGTPETRVRQLAREFGVGDAVSEHPLRLPYLDGLQVQLEASANLLIGSRERHYTASRIYPALLAGRPIVAAYHEASSASDVLRRAAPAPAVQLISINDAFDPRDYQERMLTALIDAANNRERRLPAVNQDVLADYSAEALAGRLARVLDSAVDAARF